MFVFVLLELNALVIVGNKIIVNPLSFLIALNKIKPIIFAKGSALMDSGIEKLNIKLKICSSFLLNGTISSLKNN